MANFGDRELEADYSRLRRLAFPDLIHDIDKRYHNRELALKHWILRAYKTEIGCRCGERDPIVLQFHHRNPEEKHPRLSAQRQDGNRKRRKSLQCLFWEDLFSEIQKCDVLCANCHLKEEERRRKIL